jgi:RNA polymerase sigma-70 factor (ECF subfamily)
VAAVARVDRSPELRDEVRQILWQRLFVGTGAAAPRILSYAGRGPLAGWVAVAAQRIALDLRRDAARAVASDPDAAHIRQHKAVADRVARLACRAHGRNDAAAQVLRIGFERAFQRIDRERPLPRADREHHKVNSRR